MKSILPLQLQLFWEGCPQGLGEKTWLSLRSNSSQRFCWGQDSVQFIQTLSSVTLWTWLCELSKISWFAKTFRLPFTGTKGQVQLLKNRSTPWSCSTKLYTWHSQASTVVLATIKPRLVHHYQMEKRDWSFYVESLSFLMTSTLL